MKVTVKGGDTVSGILKRLGVPSYASRSTWEAVRAANGLNSAYTIYPGQVLNIPDNLIPGAAPAAPAAPAVSPGAVAGSTAPGAGGLKFSDILPYSDYFSPELAQSAIAQRTSRYYDPLVDEAHRSTLSSFAARNLGRSGMRGRDILRMYQDYADEEARMREELFGTREKEALEGYNLERSRYEENPTGYTKPTTQANAGYKFEYPEESPYKYSKSYRDWLKEAYKM